MTDSLNTLVGRAAARQWGLVSGAQLRQLGCGDDSVSYRIRVGELVRVRRGVYRLPGAPLCWEQAVLAAAIAAGDGAVVSHATAAAVWDLRRSERNSAGLHLTAPRQARPSGVTGHRNRLTPAERTVHRHIPVTTPERTIVDLSATLRAQQLGECVDDALRRRLVRLGQLHRLVSDAARPGHGRRLLAPLHDILADASTGTVPATVTGSVRWTAGGTGSASRPPVASSG